jgi:serine/threonine protein kinase
MEMINRLLKRDAQLITSAGKPSPVSFTNFRLLASEIDTSISCIERVVEWRGPIKRAEARAFLRDINFKSRICCLLTALGQPGLQTGATPEGSPILVKVWPRQPNAADDDLKEIWHHELRQLHRLAGYPGSYELIAHLLRAGIDDKGFYLVLELGQKSLLQTLMSDGGPTHWLNQPRFEANRLLIWHNLKRLCAAVDILHSQGLLHRKLDVWSVLTSGEREAECPMLLIRRRPRCSWLARARGLLESSSSLWRPVCFASRKKKAHPFMQEGWQLFLEVLQLLAHQRSHKHRKQNEIHEHLRGCEFSLTAEWSPW